jgi:hypothetical protein
MTKPDIPVQMRSVIIACRVLYKERWIDIEKKTGINANTACKLFETLVEQAGNEDFNNLLEVAALLPRTGRNPKIVDGTHESRALQEILINNPYKYWNEYSIKLVRSTIENIAKSYNNKQLSRKVEQHKPELSADNVE